MAADRKQGDNINLTKPMARKKELIFSMVAPLVSLEIYLLDNYFIEMILLDKVTCLTVGYADVRELKSIFNNNNNNNN